MPLYRRATKKSFTKDNLTFYYWVVGDSNNPPALIVPGLGASHSDLLLMTHALRTTFFFIIPDLPGWGISPRLPSPLTVSAYASFLNNLLTHENIKDITVIGHCLGAALAIEFAHYYPHIKNLFLISTPYEEGSLRYDFMLRLIRIDHHAPHFFHNLFYFWRNREISFLLSFFVLKFKSLRKIFVITIKNFKTNSKEDEKILQENWESMLKFNYEKIKNIICPTHLIYGSRDVYISQAQALKLHAMLPHATLDFIPGAGHLPPIETPNTLGHIIMSYAK